MYIHPIFHNFIYDSPLLLVWAWEVDIIERHGFRVYENY